MKRYYITQRVDLKNPLELNYHFFDNKWSLFRDEEIASLPNIDLEKDKLQPIVKSAKKNIPSIANITFKGFFLIDLKKNKTEYNWIDIFINGKRISLDSYLRFLIQTKAKFTRPLDCGLSLQRAQDQVAKWNKELKSQVDGFRILEE